MSVNRCVWGVDGWGSGGRHFYYKGDKPAISLRYICKTIKWIVTIVYCILVSCVLLCGCFNDCPGIPVGLSVVVIVVVSSFVFLVSVLLIACYTIRVCRQRKLKSDSSTYSGWVKTSDFTKYYSLQVPEKNTISNNTYTISRMPYCFDGCHPYTQPATYSFIRSFIYLLFIYLFIILECHVSAKLSFCWRRESNHGPHS